MSSFIAMSVVLLSVYLCLLSCDAGFPEELAKHHVRVQQFKCGKPQQRSVSSYDVLRSNSKAINDSDIVRPAYTVLNRCENSGCCRAKHHCQPHKVDNNLELVFFVKRWNGPDVIVEYMNVTATNHTECSCQHISDNPK